MIDESQMLLAVDWQGESLAGWLATEKFNGCRVEWDGESFWTRNGNRVDAPKWFTKGLPRCRINGEIHAGRGVGVGNHNTAYKLAMRAVVHGADWFTYAIRFTALYAYDVSGNWAKRQAATVRAVRGCHHAEAVKPVVMSRDGSDLTKLMVGLRSGNAEGAMFLNPNGNADFGRTGDLLRIKFCE